VSFNATLSILCLLCIFNISSGKQQLWLKVTTSTSGAAGITFITIISEHNTDTGSPYTNLYSFSYPSVLGITLVKAIPAHPDRYYKWLEQKRAEYTAIEQQSEKTIFTVSPTQAQYGRVTPLVSSGLENLKCLPIYIGPPGCNS
jgi:hypothetical protein